MQIWQKNRNFSNSRWRTDAILKIVFWLYLGALLANQRKIWKGDEESHANTGYMTKTAIFQNSRWRTAAILKIALYLSRELSDFDHVWYTDANFHSEHGILTKTNRKFSNSTWWSDAILKIVFWLYLGAILADQSEIWNRNERSHADICHVTKTAIFANSRWRTAANLKLSLSPYLSRELSHFDQI